MTSIYRLIPGLALALVLGACGNDSSDKELEGSVCTTFKCEVDYVEIYRQENRELEGQYDWKVMYVKQDKQTQRWPAIVVATAPVKEGEAVPLPARGSITHVVDGAEFPELREGEVTFDTLGDVGEEASGKFFGTFVTGGTINGEFSATVQSL